MAYPDRIQSSGPITLRQVFVWWISSYINWNIDEWGPMSDTGEGQGNVIYVHIPTAPFTRAQFYSFINTTVIGNVKVPNSQPYYNYEEPEAGWNRTQVQAWGKVKGLELAYFGNVANGGSLSDTTLPELNGQNGFQAALTFVTSGKHSATFLRNALTRFETYGDCFVNEDQGSDEDGDGSSTEPPN